jgi:Kef-type K+ transport system membrane component KefB
MSDKKSKSSREEVSFLFAIVIGVVLGTLIKKIRLGIILGLILGGFLVFSGWLNARKRDDD